MTGRARRNCGLRIAKCELVNPKSAIRNQKLRNGQALIIVLWAMGLVSLAVGAVSERMTHELRLGGLASDQLQRDALTHAALHQALAVVHADEPAVDHLQESWATGHDAQDQPLLQAMALGRGQYTVTLVDEARKLNLNTASTDALTHLIEGVQPDSQINATLLAAAIADWRDAPEGSLCANRTPACHNAPLDTTQELLLVPGMTPALFAALAPYVTIYESAININTADPIVLSAAGLTTAQITTLTQQRQQQPYASVPAGLPAGLGVSSTHFEAQITATISHNSTPTLLRAILDRSGTIDE